MTFRFRPHISEVAPVSTGPTERQIAYVRGMQKQLRLADRLLDAHCQAALGSPFAQLTRYQMSTLIDQMKGWPAIPAELLREAGQLDLFGGGQ